MFKDTEKIERTLFSIGNEFTLNNVIIVAEKDKNNCKREKIYSTTYNSNKYQDTGMLKNIFIKPNYYLTFTYASYIDNKFTKEEVFISYPNLGYLKEDFLKPLIGDILSEEYPMFIDEKTVSSNYSDKVYTFNNSAGGKFIKIMPTIIERTNDLNKTTVNGFLVAINNNEYVFEVDISTFLTMCDIILNLNLELTSSNTLIMGMLYDNSGEQKHSSNNSMPLKPPVKKSFPSNSEDKLQKRPVVTKKVNKSKLADIIEENEEEPKLNLNSIKENAENMDDDDFASLFSE